VIALAIVSTIMLLLAIPPLWSYGYYLLLRIMVCVTAVALSSWAHKNEKSGWMWTMIIIAIVFNPLIPFHLGKEIWTIVDLAVAVILVISVFKLRLQESPK